MQLPTEMAPAGNVVGQVGQAIGDVSEDSSADPTIQPISGPGLVLFFHQLPSQVVSSTTPDMFVKHRPVRGNLDDNGVLCTPDGPGVKLWPGVWTVVPGDRSVFDFPRFQIEVKSTHTADNPLQLWGVSPAPVPDGATVYTLTVPTGQQPGQTLGWNGSQLAWVTPTITPTVTTLAAGSDATASMSGSWPNLTLGLGIPAGQPSAYQIVGAGRPDIPASMTTAVQAQVATAPVGSTFSSTDGASVGAWQWQKRPTGWIVTDLDTEWRIINSLLSLPLGTSAALFLRRINRTAFLGGVALNTTAAQTATFTIPTEFAPQVGGVTFTWAAASSPTIQAANGAITWNGVACKLTTGTSWADGVVSWPVRLATVCPATLPGTPR